MKTIKNKIEEMEKGCGEIMSNISMGSGKKIPYDICGKKDFFCYDCKKEIEAYKEAQNILDDTLKNIIDEIERYPKSNMFIGTKPMINISKEELKQIIQKHSQDTTVQVGKRVTSPLPDTLNKTEEKQDD